MKKFIIAIFFTACLLASIQQAGAATFTVNIGGNDGPGSLRQAVADANANNEANNVINVSSSVKEIYLASSVAITKDVVINGFGATVRGSKTSRLFNISGGLAKFDSFTFTDGYPLSESGGAAYIDSSAAAAEFVNCTFWQNRSGKSGAAVFVYGFGYNRPTTFTNCTITNNEAAENGGGVAVAGGVVQFTASIVTGNKAPSDPDVYAYGGGLISNASQYNVIGYTNAAFSEALQNDLLVRASDVFKTPDSLTNIGNVQVVELLSATANKALDKISLENALSLPKVDQRGASRPKMAGFDAGAFELDPEALSSVTIHGSSYIEALTSENYSVYLQPEEATLDVRSYTDGLEWSVTPETSGVIAVDADGRVTGLAAGYGTLTVKAHGWDNFGNPVIKEDSKEIMVGNVPLEKPSVSVSISNEKTSMFVNDQHSLNVKVTVVPAYNPYTVTFLSDDPTIATVNQTVPNGETAVVKARNTGETMIKVLVAASNSKGSSETSIGYLLTVTEQRRGGGGGGCQGGIAGSMASLLATALFLLKRSR